ncbi:MAG: CotH kinase family protein [Clostridia bacterium]|nr:CotH kinase family protein [Clostridia bacterium]
MKKIVAFILCLITIFSCFSCAPTVSEPPEVEPPEVEQPEKPVQPEQPEHLYKYELTLSVEGENTYKRHSGVILEPQITIPENKVLLGWTVNPDEKYNFVTFPLVAKKNVTLFAVFKEEQKEGLPRIDVFVAGGAITSKEEYVRMSLSMTNVLPEHELQSRTGGIRLRGNSTLGMPKKAYRIKFDKKTAFFDEDKYKSWVLLADYLDASLMKNYSALYFARQLEGLKFTSCAYHVELYIDGAYQGVYLLCEQTQEQKEGRVEIEVDEITETMVQVPFLIELNRGAEAESEFEYDWFEYGDHTYTIKYPENPTLQQYEYIVNYFTEAKVMLEKGNLSRFEELVDLNSLIDYYLVNELFINRDAIWKSGYMYKPRYGRLTFGPVWDFDWSLNTPWTGEPTVTTSLSSTTYDYFTTHDCWLKDILDAGYEDEVAKRWRTARNCALDTVTHIKQYREKFTPSAMVNYYKWYPEYEPEGEAEYEAQFGNLYEDQYQFLINFLTLRIRYFDRKWLE